MACLDTEFSRALLRGLGDRNDLKEFVGVTLCLVLGLWIRAQGLGLGLGFFKLQGLGL